MLWLIKYKGVALQFQHTIVCISYIIIAYFMLECENFYSLKYMTWFCYDYDFKTLKGTVSCYEDNQLIFCATWNVMKCRNAKQKLLKGVQPNKIKKN